MSNGIKRVGKGLFAIFMIKLVLISGLFIFQSCQQESDFDAELQQESKTNFLAALQESNQKIREISLKKYSDNTNRDGNDMFTAKDDLSYKQICLETLLATSDTDTVTTIVSDPIDTSGVLTLGDVFDVAEQTNTRPVVVDDSVIDPVVDDTVTNTAPTLDCFSVPTAPTVAALAPSIVEAKNYLYSNQFSDSDIEEILDGEDESNLVPLVMVLIAEEQQQANNSSITMNYLELFGTSSYAQNHEGDGPNLYDCALRSLGISALTDAFSNGLNSRLGKRALKKAIKKIALRTLGWVGAAWAAYEFGGCMNWW